MDTTEYLDLRRRISSEYRRNLGSLNRVWRLANPGQDPPQVPRRHDHGRLEAHDETPPSPLGNGTPRAESGEIMAAVARAVGVMDGDFNWAEIQAQMQSAEPNSAFNRAQVNQVLRKMVQDHVIEIVEQGAGRRASVYRKVEQQE